MEAKFFIEGKEICTVAPMTDATFNYEAERKTFKNGDNLSLMSFDYIRTMTINLEKVRLHQDVLDSLMINMPYTVKGIGYDLPKGERLPKKKRIRKKWLKKYGHEFEIYNCYLKY